MEITPLFIIEKTNITLVPKLLNTLSTDGYNRAHSEIKLINADTDAQAIVAFLNEYKESSNTFMTYAKEIERLLLWCLHVANSGLSELTRDHILEYQRFMMNPPACWCGVKVSRYKKDGSLNKDWKPFFKKLGESTTKKALKIIDSFFSYLVEMHYLQGNPVALNRRRKQRAQPAQRLVERYLEMDEINAVLDALTTYPHRHARDNFRIARAYYIILLLFYAGLRISEASDHTMGNFIQRDHCWFLSVIGKGKKHRDIPVPDALFGALKNFRKELGLPSPEPTFQEDTPLIPNASLQQALQRRRIDQIVKWAFDLGAAAIENQSPHKASKLRQASAHWLRHSYVTYLLDSGAPLKVAQENAGHSNISTTMLYRHVSQTNRHTATRHLEIEVSPKKVQKKKPEPIVRTTLLGPNNNQKKQITLELYIAVENNSKFVRGKGRSLQDIERNVLSEYDLKVIDRECGKYEITLYYTTHENLDEQIQEIASESESIADYRNGFIEFDTNTIDREYSWPFSYYEIAPENNDMP
jgi:site-specific recombinase XerD